MADAGVPLHVLKETLGHASMETTRGYVHPDDRHRVRRRASQRVPVTLRQKASGHPKRTRNAWPLTPHQAPTHRLETVLVPFWSPYLLEELRGRLRYPQPHPAERSRGTRRGPKYPASGNNKTLMKISFSSGFFCRADRI